MVTRKKWSSRAVRSASGCFYRLFLEEIQFHTCLSQVLQNPRLYNLSGTQLHGSIIADCVSDPTLVKLRIAVSNVEYVFIYDYVFPGHLTYGQVIVTSDYFGQVFYIESPSEGEVACFEKPVLDELFSYKFTSFTTYAGDHSDAGASFSFRALRLEHLFPISEFSRMSVPQRPHRLVFGLFDGREVHPACWKQYEFSRETQY